MPDLQAVQQQQQRLKDYQRSAAQIAQTVFRYAPRAMDANAHTCDDYITELRTKAWHAQDKFAEHEIHDVKQESRWVHASVWNEARYLQRKCKVADSHRARTIPDLHELLTTDDNPESMLIAKEAINNLQTHLDDLELDLLQRLAEHGHNLTKTLASYGKPVSLKTFLYMVKRLKARAAKILTGEFTNLGKLSGLSGLYINEESDMSDVPDIKPECYGLLWEPFGDSECIRCGAQTQCLAALAQTAYHEAEQRLTESGKEITPESLSNDLGINVMAVGAVQEYLSRLPQVVPPPVVEPELIPEPEAPVAEVAAPEPPKEKKKRGRKPKPKADNAETVAAVVPSVPQMADPVGSAGQPAKTRKTQAKIANPVKARGATSPKKRRKKKKKSTEKQVWGDHTYPERWRREREKNSLIGALTPGTTISRVYKGKTYSVQIKAGHYLYNGEKYATLQAATTAATGLKKYRKQLINGERSPGTRMLCNWNAMRFWKIRELVTGVRTPKLTSKS